MHGLAYFMCGIKRVILVLLFFFGAAVRAFIETWKVKRLLSNSKVVTSTDDNDDKTKQPFLKPDEKLDEKLEDKQKETNESSRMAQVQQEVDQQTMWYITHFGIPAMVAYAAFSLSIYMRHNKSPSLPGLSTSWSLPFNGLSLSKCGCSYNGTITSSKRSILFLYLHSVIDS